MGEAEFRCSPRNTRVTLEEQIEGYLIRRDDHDPNPSGGHVQAIGQGGHEEVQRIHEQTAQEEPPVRWVLGRAGETLLGATTIGKQRVRQCRHVQGTPMRKIDEGAEQLRGTQGEGTPVRARRGRVVLDVVKLEVDALGTLDEMRQDLDVTSDLLLAGEHVPPRFVRQARPLRRDGDRTLAAGASTPAGRIHKPMPREQLVEVLSLCALEHPVLANQTDARHLSPFLTCEVTLPFDKATSGSRRKKSTVWENCSGSENQPPLRTVLRTSGGRQDSLPRQQPTNDENNSRSQAVVGAEEESPLTHGSCQGVLAAAVSEACVG